MGFRNNFAATGIKNVFFYISLRRSIIGKFVIVSGSAVGLNLLFLYLLVNYAGLNSPLGQNIANFISMELSIIYNYFLSRSITWRERQRETGRNLFYQILKFHATIGITVLLRLGLFRLLQIYDIHYILNAAIGIALSSVINFIIYDSMVFKKEQ
jgi:dolichol-phosphate mannosyltransferase